MENPGAKVEIFLVEKNAVSLRIQNGVNVQRVKETVTQMLVVLVILCVDLTTVGIIMQTPHQTMTAALQPLQEQITKDLGSVS